MPNDTNTQQTTPTTCNRCFTVLSVTGDCACIG